MESNRNTRLWAKSMSATLSSQRDTVLTVLDRQYGGMRHASKILAQHANASYRTAEKWLAGTSAPGGETIVELMAGNQDFEFEILRLVQERRAARK